MRAGRTFVVVRRRCQSLSFRPVVVRCHRYTCFGGKVGTLHELQPLRIMAPDAHEAFQGVAGREFLAKQWLTVCLVYLLGNRLFSL